MAQANEILKVDGRNVPLSNLDKILYPIARFTKGQVIDYYVKASQFILPHLKNRPITLAILMGFVVSSFMRRTRDADSSKLRLLTQRTATRLVQARRGRPGKLHVDHRGRVSELSPPLKNRELYAGIRSFSHSARLVRCANFWLIPCQKFVARIGEIGF
jgi:hypothetical protein